MGYDVLLLDADRTLFDTAQMEVVAMQQLMAELGIPYVPQMAADYYAINEALWQKIETGELTREFVRPERFRLMKERYHLPKTPVELNERYVQLFQVANLLNDGALAVCQQLSQTKRLAVITNGTKDVQKVRFPLSPITDCLEAIFISEEIGYPKPQPEFFNAVLTAMGITDKSHVLIVGDSLTGDILGGNLSGMDTCWYNPLGETNHTTAVPTYEITSLWELPVIADAKN